MNSLHDRLRAVGPLTRVIGQARGAAAGPSLLVVAGIHGNEPAGVLAARRVFARLERDRLPIRGDFTVLAGNLAALSQGVRGVSRDLNRGWGRDALETSLPAAPSSEDREQRELLLALDAARTAARGPITFLDLHSTSAPGIPFAMVRDLPEPRRFAQQFPLPIIIGLLELVDSTLLEFMRRKGCVALGVEAGQNDAESSVDHHEAVLWTALAAAGLLAPDDFPALERYRDLLAAARGTLPHVTRVDHRHAITPEDGFRMLDGFGNLERVAAGQLLAHDRRGEIRAPRACVLLLPLYQAQGDDGFFLGSELPRETYWTRTTRTARSPEGVDSRTK